PPEIPPPPGVLGQVFPQPRLESPTGTIRGQPEAVHLTQARETRMRMNAGAESVAGPSGESLCPVEQDQGFQSQAKSTVEAPAFLQSPEAAVAVGHPGQPAPIVSSAADGRWWRDEERPTTHGALDLPPAVMNTFVGSFCLTRKPELVVRSAADGSVHHDRR